MNLQDIIQYLKENKYLLYSKGEYVLSKEFQQICKKSRGTIVKVDIETVPKHEVAVFNPTVLELQIQKLKTMDWGVLFIQFIQDAKVPARLENNRGELYAANKYNEDARKVFQKALEKEGFIYDLLVKSTMLYYKSGIRYKKAIGNYINSGDFRTDYLALKQSVEAGEVTLQNHLKQETNDGQYSPYRLG